MPTHYLFEFSNAKDNFQYVVRGPAGREPAASDRPTPAWCRLEAHRCVHCPLAAGEAIDCPAAVQVAEVVEHFKRHQSIERVTLHIQNPPQQHSLRTDLQKALALIYPLLLARSACPHARLLAPLSRFATCFPDAESGVFLLLANALVGKWFEAQDSECATMSYDIDAVMRDISFVFHGLLGRFREASEGDANINAIVKDIQWSYGVLQSPQTILRSLRASLLSDGALAERTASS